MRAAAIGFPTDATIFYLTPATSMIGTQTASPFSTTPPHMGVVKQAGRKAQAAKNLRFGWSGVYESILTPQPFPPLPIQKNLSRRTGSGA